MNTAPLIKNVEQLKTYPDRNVSYTAGVIAEWLKSIEFKLLENEMELDMVSGRLAHYDDRTEIFFKLLVITGNADKLVTMQILESEKFNRAVNFLFEVNDRLNHHNIFAVATLLDLAANEGKEIHTIKDLVNYANGK